MYRLFALIICVLSCASVAQEAQASSERGAGLQGTVTKDPGSEPLKKALIELIAESQNEGRNYTALSAADGSFCIENVAPGRYRLFVERSGFREIDIHRHPTEGRVLTFTSGQEIKDLIIRLQAAAVIEGRVSDEDGDPMPESQIATFRRTFVAGRVHWDQAGAERSNDLGEYRIANLPAGSYFISVIPPPDFKSLIETSTPSHNSSDPIAATAYQTTYYPGTRDRGQAVPVQLHPGDDFPANFTLTPNPSLTIRGSVVNLPPGSTATVSLQSKDFNLMLNGAEMRKDGSFEIRDVSPGGYTILATVDNSPVPMMARQSLQLTESVDGIRLAPQPGASIRGRFRIETNAASRPDLSQMFLLLRSADDDDSALANVAMGGGFSNLAHVNADGSFAWNDVPAGHYFVQLSDSSGAPDFFLKSVVASGRDVSETGFTIGGGASVLDIAASSQGAAIGGLVIDEKEEPFAGATVVAIPEARLRNHPDRYRKATTDQAGRFTLRGLPPGSYSVFAWKSVDGEAYFNTEFVNPYEGKGKTLRVAEAEKVSIQLQAIPEAGDEPPQ